MKIHKKSQKLIRDSKILNNKLFPTTERVQFNLYNNEEDRWHDKQFYQTLRLGIKFTSQHMLTVLSTQKNFRPSYCKNRKENVVHTVDLNEQQRTSQRQQLSSYSLKHNKNARMHSIIAQSKDKSSEKNIHQKNKIHKKKPVMLLTQLCQQPYENTSKIWPFYMPNRYKNATSNEKNVMKLRNIPIKKSKRVVSQPF